MHSTQQPDRRSAASWIHERQGQPQDPLFPTSRGRPLTRDAVAWLLTKHATTARTSCPSIGAKTITPHVLRHSTAMRLLHAGVDTSVIALWLGHEKTDTVQIYLHADLALKERALARTAPLETTPGRYRPTDALLNFLEDSDYAEAGCADPLFRRQSSTTLGIIRHST